MPVIMLTGDSEAQTAVQCLKDGAEDYLVKPVDLEELLIAVRRATDRVRLLRESDEQRQHLEVVKNQSVRLREAFHVIEATYQDALGALLNAQRRPPPEETSPAGESNSSTVSEAPSVPPDVLPNVESEARQAVELTALRVAGRMIGDGASFQEVGTAIGRELVDHAGLACFRIWLDPGDEAHPQALVEVGSSAIDGFAQARQAISMGEAGSIDSEGFTSVVCPILLHDAPQAVLQLVVRAGESSTVQSAERLALLFAASLAREHDARERRRTMEELDLFYKLASASRYSLDLEHVAEFLLESLDRIVDYDVASLLLLDEEASLVIQTRFPADERFTGRVREHVLNNLKLTCGVEPPNDLRVRSREVDSGHSRPAPKKLRSFVNAPLTVAGSVVGLVYVGSGRDRAFADSEVQFVHRAANFLATSVQGVRELVAAVKGRVEQMVDHMTDGVLMLDRRGSVVAMNRAAREALNCHEETEEPMNASRLAELLDVDTLELMRAEKRSLRRLVCVRGVAYQAQLSPVLSESDELVGAVVAFRNFEEEKKIDEMKTELVNVVSHELRTPLTAIKNALSLLQSTRLGTLGEKQSHFVGLAQRNVEQLVSIINDLLDLSKFEAGKMHIDLNPLDLSDPITSALGSVEPQAEEKGITLEASIESGLPLVHGDAGSLQRVLVNLLGNAIKFTGKGGRVSVAAVRSEYDAPGEKPCPAIQVAVTDSGVGIPEDQIESIFDKFHQVAGGNRHTTTVGTGLGLPISRELIKAHHGRIWAESKEGSGSRLSFVIPLLSDAELLFRCLKADIDRAREVGAPVVIALASCQNGPVREGATATGDVEQRLRLVADAAQRVTRRSADRVFLIRDKAQVVVVLPRTPREGGVVFEGRLANEIPKTNLADNGVVFRVGCASFPDDADSAESLYSRAEANLRECALA